MTDAEMIEARTGTAFGQGEEASGGAAAAESSVVSRCTGCWVSRKRELLPLPPLEEDGKLARKPQ